MLREDSKKILLVTGASSDIGRALIRKIEANYSLIWAHYYHSRKSLDDLQMELGEKIVPVHADFSDRESTINLIEILLKSGEYPNHIVHLPALKIFHQRFHKCDWEAYQEAMDISLRSITMILKALLPEMLKKKYGKIVFVLTSSILGIPPKYQNPYVTVKYALLGLMRGLSAEYIEKGITVNAISPDMVETKFLSNLSDIVVAQNAYNNPLGRNLTTADVVPAFEFLLSEAADMITGQNIGVTGGMR